MKREEIIKYTSDNLLEIIKGRKVYVKMSSWMQEMIVIKATEEPQIGLVFHLEYEDKRFWENTYDYQEV